MISTLLQIPYMLFIFPIKSLYFKGPSIYGWGGWGGINAADICSQLTQVPSSHWTIYYQGCNELLERKFESFMVVVGFSVYLWALYKLISYLWFRYFIVAPLMAEIKSMFPEKVNQLVLKDAKQI